MIRWILDFLRYDGALVLLIVAIVLCIGLLGWAYH